MAWMNTRSTLACTSRSEMTLCVEVHKSKEMNVMKTTIDKLMILSLAVSDMPKAKAFYADKLGLNVASDYRKDDDHWWVSLILPENGASITLTSLCQNRRLCGYFSSWLTTHSQHFCGLAYQCADFFYLGPHGSQ